MYKMVAGIAEGRTGMGYSTPGPYSYENGFAAGTMHDEIYSALHEIKDGVPGPVKPPDVIDNDTTYASFAKSLLHLAGIDRHGGKPIDMDMIGAGDRPDSMTLTFKGVSPREAQHITQILNDLADTVMGPDDPCAGAHALHPEPGDSAAIQLPVSMMKGLMGVFRDNFAEMQMNDPGLKNLTGDQAAIPASTQERQPEFKAPVAGMKI
jgi:hypothetical protein